MSATPEESGLLAEMTNPNVPAGISASAPKVNISASSSTGDPDYPLPVREILDNAILRDTAALDRALERSNNAGGLPPGVSSEDDRDDDKKTATRTASNGGFSPSLRPSRKRSAPRNSLGWTTSRQPSGTRSVDFNVGYDETFEVSSFYKTTAIGGGGALSRSFGGVTTSSGTSSAVGGRPLTGGGGEVPTFSGRGASAELLSVLEAGSASPEEDRSRGSGRGGSGGSRRASAGQGGRGRTRRDPDDRIIPREGKNDAALHPTVPNSNASAPSSSSSSSTTSSIIVTGMQQSYPSSQAQEKAQRHLLGGQDEEPEIIKEEDDAAEAEADGKGSPSAQTDEDAGTGCGGVSLSAATVQQTSTSSCLPVEVGEAASIDNQDQSRTDPPNASVVPVVAAPADAKRPPAAPAKPLLIGIAPSEDGKETDENRNDGARSGRVEATISKSTRAVSTSRSPDSAASSSRGAGGVTSSARTKILQFDATSLEQKSEENLVDAVDRLFDDVLMPSYTATFASSKMVKSSLSTIAQAVQQQPPPPPPPPPPPLASASSSHGGPPEDSHAAEPNMIFLHSPTESPIAASSSPGLSTREHDKLSVDEGTGRGAGKYHNKDQPPPPPPPAARPSGETTAEEVHADLLTIHPSPSGESAASPNEFNMVKKNRSGATSSGPPRGALVQPQGELPLPSVPASFLCPLTDGIMVDPVYLRNGDTFERAAIAEWLVKNNTHPLTGAELSDRTLYANVELKQCIEFFLTSCRPELREQQVAEFTELVSSQKRLRALVRQFSPNRAEYQKRFLEQSKRLQQKVGQQNDVIAHLKQAVDGYVKDIEKLKKKQRSLQREVGEQLKHIGYLEGEVYESMKKSLDEVHSQKADLVVDVEYWKKEAKQLQGEVNAIREKERKATTLLEEKDEHIVFLEEKTFPRLKERIQEQKEELSGLQSKEAALLDDLRPEVVIPRVLLSRKAGWRPLEEYRSLADALDTLLGAGTTEKVVNSLREQVEATCVRAREPQDGTCKELSELLLCLLRLNPRSPPCLWKLLTEILNIVNDHLHVAANNPRRARGNDTSQTQLEGGEEEIPLLLDQLVAFWRGVEHEFVDFKLFWTYFAYAFRVELGQHFGQLRGTIAGTSAQGLVEATYDRWNAQYVGRTSSASGPQSGTTSQPPTIVATRIPRVSPPPGEQDVRSSSTHSAMTLESETEEGGAEVAVRSQTKTTSTAKKSSGSSSSLHPASSVKKREAPPSMIV